MFVFFIPLAIPIHIRLLYSCMNTAYNMAVKAIRCGAKFMLFDAYEIIAKPKPDMLLNYRHNTLTL